MTQNIFPFSRQFQLASVTQSSDVTSGSITRPQGGWKPLGFDDDGRYIVLSLKTGQPVALCAADMTERKLVQHLGSSIRQACRSFDSRLGADAFDVTFLEQQIVSACEALGPFDPASVRGPGLYRTGDFLTINLGNEVVSSTASGELSSGCHSGFMYVRGPSLGITRGTPPATRREIQQLVDTVESFGISGEEALIKILGWAAMAFYGPVLEHRPILALSAERGSGKSTLLELISALLGPQTVHRHGVPTAAQILYEMKGQSSTVLIDEFEAQRSGVAAMDKLFETFRVGFTRSDDQRLARVIGGKAQGFYAPAGVLVAGINLPNFNPATESRTVRVAMKSLPSNAASTYRPLLDHTKHNETLDFGARVRRLLIERWPVMCSAVKACRQVLIQQGHEARSADKLAAILGGYVALTKGCVPPKRELHRLTSLFTSECEDQASFHPGSTRCLEFILNKRVALVGVRNQRQVKEKLTIREALQSVIHGDAEHQRSTTKQLEVEGIRPIWSRSDGRWRLAVCTSEHHAELRKLMQPTEWSNGSWRGALLRQPGASSCVQRMAGGVHRVVVIDMPEDLLAKPDTADHYEFPHQGTDA